MSITTIKNQIETTQNAPLDVKLTPVDSLNELYHIPRSERYVSMTIFVKSENDLYLYYKDIFKIYQIILKSKK